MYYESNEKFTFNVVKCILIFFHFIILLIDYVTPSEIIVGFLYFIPIIFSSYLTKDKKFVFWGGILAVFLNIIGFVISDMTQNYAFAISNRILAISTITICTGVSIQIIIMILEMSKLDKISSMTLEGSPNGMILVNSKGKILLVNRQITNIFGYNREELVGNLVDMLVPNETIEGHPRLRNSFIKNPTPRRMGTGRDLFGRNKDGTLVPVEVGLTPIKTDNEIFVVSSVVDISERLKYENELKKKNRELDDFVYVASHDLKAPLRVIDNASKWLEEDLKEHLKEENLEIMLLIRNRVKRMEKLLDDLLEYSRIGRTTDNTFREKINVKTLLNDIFLLLNASNKFSFEVSESCSTIEVFRMPVEQILLNLINNAIKHHDKKFGTISIDAVEKNDKIIFSVKDDGPGIPSKYHEKIFKMFQTLKPRDKVEGSGMGLAIIKKHLDNFEETIRIKSSETKGSTFSFTWAKIK